MSGLVTSLRVFVDGVPKAQPRPRAFARNGKAHVYDSGTAEYWKGLIALAVKPYRPACPWTTPVCVELAFVFPRPKSHFTKKGLRADAPDWHIARPDVENCVKSALDCLTTIGVWHDDSQVASLETTKRYGERPGCMIVARCIET